MVGENGSAFFLFWVYVLPSVKDGALREEPVGTCVGRAPGRAGEGIGGRPDTSQGPEEARRGGDALQRRSGGLSDTAGPCEPGFWRTPEFVPTTREMPETDSLEGTLA